jgi:thiosulfate/3-mercaptopyruvate sulfurtransferase
MSEKTVQNFVSIAEVTANQNFSKYKILDLREEHKFHKGHIKGAIHINNEYFTQQNEDGINILPDKEVLEEYLKGKGINQNDKLILVDDVFNLNCSLAAWTLHYFGFDSVILLDGAYSKWEQEINEFTTEIHELPKGNICLDKINDQILITKDEIMINIQSKDFIFVDNRSEYALLLDQQGGNIPGAIHFWYLDMFEEFPDYFILKSKESILEELKIREITSDKTVVVYCESAPQSALVYLVLKDLNYPDVRLYLAGYDEWRLFGSFM